jgi:hypothetical protein
VTTYHSTLHVLLTLAAGPLVALNTTLGSVELAQPRWLIEPQWTVPSLVMVSLTRR